MQNRLTDHVRSNVIGYAALFLALTGGVAWANHPGGADTISSGDIINGEVRSQDVGDGEVKNNDLGANSVGSGKIADQSVKNADLGVGASSSNTIADGGIQNIDVANNTLTGAKIDESTLFNDNSLTGADIDESTLSGLPSADAWNLIGNSGTTAANFLGTTDNQPLDVRVNDARALRLEPASDGTNQSPNVIGGIADNQVTSGVHSATIGGGGRGTPASPATANRVTDHQGTVGGGVNNQAGDGAGSAGDRALATVGGGGNNTASGERATLGGGFFNTASGNTATVAGGSGNTASGARATAGGGGANDVSGDDATVGGGFANGATGDWATVPGGLQSSAQGDYGLAAGRRAEADHQGAFVWADSNNFFFPSTAQDQFSVRSTGGARLVSGIDGSGDPASGLELPAGVSGWSTLTNGEPFDIRVNGFRGFRIEPATDFVGNQRPNVIGGSAENSVRAGVFSATIGGGGMGEGNNPDPGSANEVLDDFGTVGGGSANTAGTGTFVDRGAFATVGGGEFNVANSNYATVGGGQFNEASGDFGTTVGGGSFNAARDESSTVGGGIHNAALEDAATVGGGELNTASGVYASTVGGGSDNTASGQFATVAGGNTNTAAGEGSFAAGSLARANHDGSFVWADSQFVGPNFMDSTAEDQFIARASGNFFLQSDSTLDNQGGFINTSTGGFLSSGGAWTNASDENLKGGFERLDPRDVLEQVESLPVRSWHYKAEPSVRHVGPVAQDFHRAFGVGSDNKHIASVDADGVALAAIKGLSRRLRAERQRRNEQERRLARLEARLAALERGGR